MPVIESLSMSSSSLDHMPVLCLHLLFHHVLFVVFLYVYFLLLCACYVFLCLYLLFHHVPDIVSFSVSLSSLHHVPVIEFFLGLYLLFIMCLLS